VIPGHANRAAADCAISAQPRAQCRRREQGTGDQRECGAAYRRPVLQQWRIENVADDAVKQADGDRVFEAPLLVHLMDRSEHVVVAIRLAQALDGTLTIGRNPGCPTDPAIG
jgi:hypothetical protein